MTGYLTVGYEVSTEYTYPEDEHLSAGILNIANNVYGVILVTILGIIVKYDDVSVHLGLCLALFIGLLLTILTKDEKRRQVARKELIYQKAATEEICNEGKVDI